MYRVEVKNPCSCFVKNGFMQISEFEMSEQLGHYTICIKPRT